MFAVLKRKSSNDFQTLGVLKVFNLEGENVYRCNTLELADKDNQRNISRIPKGEYKVEKHTSPRFGQSFWVKDVPGRSEILIHAGNFFTDTKGCILPGKSFTDLNYDGFEDVTTSRQTISELYDILPDQFTLTIKDENTNTASDVGGVSSL